VACNDHLDRMAIRVEGGDKTKTKISKKRYTLNRIRRNLVFICILLAVWANSSRLSSKYQYYSY
jgi:hypothetical protein